jgi:hypothetical protein
VAQNSFTAGKALRDMSAWRRPAVIVLMVLFSSLVWQSPNSAAAPVDMSLNPFLVLFPELETAPAPSQWLKVGKRWTYYYQYAGVFDPDVDTPRSGAGLFQFDLVALTNNRSVVSLKVYGENSKGFLVPSAAVADIQLPGLGGFWLAPAVLVDAERVANPNLRVIRIPRSPKNPTCPCVRFQSTSEDDSAEYVWMFEETTGRLVFYRHRIGPETDPDQTAQVWLRQERTLPLPWRASRVRSWVTAPAWTMDFSGYQKFAYGYNDPSPIYLEYFTHVNRKRYQQEWGEYAVTDYLYTDQTGWVKQGTIRSITGIAQLFDPLWVPAKAFSVAANWPLNQWIQLDRDPATKATVLGLRRADKTAVLREQGPLTRFGLPVFQTDMRYRQSDGKLVEVVRTDVIDLLSTFMTTSAVLNLE